jgi:hypothetical protein
MLLHPLYYIPNFNLLTKKQYQFYDFTFLIRPPNEPKSFLNAS